MKNTFPGVYELAVKRPGYNALLPLPHQFVTDSTPGAELEIRGKTYVIINRSGLSPKGQLILKEV